MRASIVIPTFNGSAHIRDQLDALARQSGLDDVEIVVSDNGSTDDTVDIVRSYEDRFPHLVVVDSAGDRGVSFARNAGAAIARGDELLFIDDDDVVGDGWLDAMLAALAEHPFVAARLEHRLLNPDWTIGHRGEPQVDGLERAVPPYLDFAFGGTLGVHRSIHEAVGGFAVEFRRGADDCDYCYRIALSGTALTFAPDAIVHYRHRQRLPALFAQARTYGESTVRLLSIYHGQGMGRPSVPKAIASWVLMVPRLPFELPTRAGRARWVWRLGWRLGRLEGSARWGIFSP